MACKGSVPSEPVIEPPDKVARPRPAPDLYKKHALGRYYYTRRNELLSRASTADGLLAPPDNASISNEAERSLWRIKSRVSKVKIQLEHYVVVVLVQSSSLEAN